jgi:RHS repeat-associated protein
LNKGTADGQAVPRPVSPARPASAAAGPLPAVSQPKGGGAVRGIGEKFSVNPSSGTGSLTIPIAVSPARAGMEPKLELAYDSGAGNGPFGFGWSAGVAAIARKTDKGLPRYDDAGESDVFILSGAEDLVPVLAGSQPLQLPPRTVHGVVYDIRCYRPRIEGLFARIERWTPRDGSPSHWRSISRDNVTTLYGFDDDSRVFDPGDRARVFSWSICRTWDDKGNIIVYKYVREDPRGVVVTSAHESNRAPAARTAGHYLERIRYGNATPYLPTWLAAGTETPLPAKFHFELVLDYGGHSGNAPLPTPAVDWPVRPDPFSSYRAGFEVRTYRRCERFLLFHHFPAEPGVGDDCLVRSTDLRYSDEDAPTDPRNPIYTFLSSVTQAGYRRDGGGYLRQTMPPVEFEYTKPVIQPEVRTVDAASLENLPAGFDSTNAQFVDLDGEGLSGILTDEDGSWGYKRNLGALESRVTFGPREPVPAIPSRSALGRSQQFLDLAGDGRVDLVTFAEPPAGFFERTAGGQWEPFRTFASLPRIDWAEPNLRFVDLTGDGHADLLITEENAFTFYASLGEDGFGEAQRVGVPWDEQRGPAAVVADGTQSIFLADMTGDGLNDIVRIRFGEVCYWPNLGYGRFGAKVTMDGSPHLDSEDRFDPRRVRLADIDGSGTTDLLYVGADGVLVCFNRGGNAWAEPRRIAVFPAADALSSVQAADLLGNGTACLVWSSPLPGQAHAPMRYVDLMGGQKPHLLVRTRNNLGAETRMRYAPSTRFYLQDRRAGRPWITRLPFPVHVVEQVEVYDWIGRSRFVTRYAYHHGYFDGAEREFRGFGMVEQWDTAAHRDDTLFPDADPANEDAASFVPPAHTKTWFHTGAFLDSGNVSRQYANEYWAEPSLRGDAPAKVTAREAMLLPDSVLDPSLEGDELREAYRALKGQVLRIESYSDDDNARAEHPYTVTEQNFTIRAVQPHGPNRYAVFFTHPRESIACHYERVPEDPRVTHETTLEVDPFGNVLRSVTVGYPRRGTPNPESALSLQFRTMLAHDQARMHVAAAQRIFTKPVNGPESATAIDDYRSPLPSQVITAELLGLAKPALRFSIDDLETHWTALWPGAKDVAYEDVPLVDVDGSGPAVPYGRRIVEHSRTLYRRDDLTALLPPGDLDPHALPGESWRLAFTPALLNRIFGTTVTDTILGEGGYFRFPGESHWWIPSGRAFYSAGDADAPAVELAAAKAHFYQPRRAADPFGNISRVSYDGYDLLAATTTDAAGNVTTATHDYRVLQPARVVDPNGNTAEAAFDALGAVAGTAVYGKAGEGDSLAGFVADLSDAAVAALRANPLANAAAALGQATSRIVVDEHAYFRTRHLAAPDPPLTYTITRETHVSDLPAGASSRLHHTLVYSDGFGREAQQKAQAEPGPVPGVGPNVSPRWTGTGWTIYNNKGKPVRQYEPFFSDTHAFEFDRTAGVSSVFFYDPAGRVVATLHPDDTFEKTRFDAWQQKVWDRNDTVGTADPRNDADVGGHFQRLLGNAPFLSWYDRRIGGTFGATAEERAANQDAAVKADAHDDTPATSYFDSLGRTTLVVHDNGGADRYPTRTVFDAENQPLCFFDPLGRHVMELAVREPFGGTYRYAGGYDLAGRPLYRNSMEGGARRMLPDVGGQPIRLWDARGSAFRFRYDALRRPTHRYVTSGVTTHLLERIVYGEKHADAARNLKGRLFRHYDGAGCAANERYDFRGNVRETSRHFAKEYRGVPDWTAIETIAEAPSLDVAGMDAATAGLLVAADRFTARTSFNAANQPTQIVTPHAAAGRPSVIQPQYNEASLPERLDVWIRQASAPAKLLDPATADRHAVTDVDYDAHGRRILVAQGNGSTTSYTYDEQTFRLVALTTVRPHADPQKRTLQELAYTYDPTGNITRLRDSADIHNVVYFTNQRVDPTGDYTYDAIYRLTFATGREHLGQTGGVLDPPAQIASDDGRRTHSAPGTRLLRPTDGRAMGVYKEKYTYDPAGNILALVHEVASGSWTRRSAYDEASAVTGTEKSNRLSATSLPGDPAGGPYSATYQHDAHGNMTRMSHLPLMTWDALDRLKSSSRQVVVGGTPETTYYDYDAGGERLRKTTDHAAAATVDPKRRNERLYLGPIEVYREYDGAGAVTLERETLHVGDDERRVAIVETRTAGTDPAPAQLIRYQYPNHLRSSSLELDEAADVLSYEEYFPYGGTAYAATRKNTELPKRYRYSGKERDEENDLYYYGARYYAPWLGRWTACDPDLLADGTNPYMFVRNKPTGYRDIGGKVAAVDDAALIVLGVGAIAIVGVMWLTMPSNRENIRRGVNAVRERLADRFAPAPEPVPIPLPMPPVKPTATPAPLPVPVPIPIPVPVPPTALPKPVPVPIPVPVPKPVPLPKPHPAPDPRPKQGPKPKPEKAPEPKPDPKAGPEKTVDPIPAPPDENDPELDAWVVRGGVTTPQQLQGGVAEHKGVPGLHGFSVQSAPGLTVEQLAANRFPHKTISVTTVRALLKVGYVVVPSPGAGFHQTVVTPDPLPLPEAAKISSVFSQRPNPAPLPPK